MWLPAPRIEFKVAAFAATLVVATAVAVGSWTASQYGDALAAYELRDLDGAVVSARGQVQGQAEATASLAATLAARRSLTEPLANAVRQPAARPALERMLAVEAAGHPFVVALRVRGPEGTPLAESWRSAPLTLRAPRGTARPQIAAGAHVRALASGPGPSVMLGPAEAPGGERRADALLVSAAAVARGTDGSPVGLVEVVFDLGALLGDIRAATADRLRTGAIDLYALDAEGRPLGDAGHARPLDGWSAAELDALARLAGRADTGVAAEPVATSLDGGGGPAALVAAHRHLRYDAADPRSGGFTLVAVAPMAELLREHSTARGRNVAVTAIILLAALLLVVGYTRALTRPLRRMAVAVDRFAAGAAVGDLPTLRLDRRDEIGRLEAGVLAMLRQVEERQLSLEREIGEREAADRRLRESRRVLAESEIRYRRLYEGIAAGVLTLGADGRLLQANPALLRMLLHSTEQELLAREFADEVYAGPGTLDAVLQRVRAHGEIANVEIRLRRRDGRSIVGLATVRAVWDDAGETAQFEATLVDVTDLKLAESQRRSTELRFRRLFDSNTVGVLYGNLERGTLDDANDYLLGMLGLRRSELPLLLATLTPDDYAAQDERVGRELAENGRAEAYQKEYLHRDGSRVPVLSSAALVDPSRGDFIGVVIDRTAEVKAAREVAASKAFYELLLDSVPTRIAAVDAEERVYYWNRAYREWFGIADAAPGKTIAEAVGPTRYAAVQSQIRRALAGETVRFETEIVRDGRRYAVDITYSPVRDAQGRVTGFLSFVHDLTAHRELEERIRENQRLATVTQLTGGIAHDFHDLLTVVIGHLQLLERHVAGERALAEPLAAATRAATRGAALARRFLTLQRPETERRREVVPGAVVAELAPMARHVLGARIDLRLDVARNRWAVAIDPEQLENALLNLLGNARDALPEGGQVTLSCRDAAADPGREALAGEHVVVAVADDGCGMTPDVLAHAFEPFFSTKHHGRGTGLGLSMVQAFAQAAGGAVRVDSARHRGTRIELWLPRAIAGEVPAERPGTAVVTTEPERSLGKPLLEASGN
jgi:PAS domain S-box-containing protein